MAAIFVLPCLLPSLGAQESSPPKTALDAIESERGGRHWADAKTDPPRSPEQSLAAFEIEQGYKIELVAAEPLVKDPVAITFDQRGRMFVMEYSDYPIGPPDGEPSLSKIVMLADSDHDGTLDQRYVFADDLDFANSIMAYKDGLLVGAKTKILFLKDTDGDHVADVRETLFDGFTPAHAQMQICNPRWGIDNWIYLNYGPGNVASNRQPDVRKPMPRKDFRFHPLTMQFNADSGLGQYGNTIDRWGNRFYCTNRNPIITTFLSPEIIDRNPFHVVPQPFYDVGKAGGETRVYPLLKMKSNYLSHAGTHTAACGTTAYIGDLGNADFRDSVFVCEPIGHLVTRSVIDRNGIRLEAKRAEEKRDFLASTDSWFRPSNLANGPDGALYLADMYRLWVEHPKFLPPEIAAKLDWRAGEDRGRIYRITPIGTDVIPFVSPDSAEAIVKLLASSNGWQRFLGQRLLVENQTVDLAPLVRTLLHDQRPTTRLHAIWTLDGLNALQTPDVIESMGDRDPHLRVAGIQLCRPWLDQPAVFDAVVSLASDSDVRVRFEVALALSGIESPQSTQKLVALARHDGHDPYFADGLCTSTKNRSGAVLASLVSVDGFDVKNVDLIKRLATVVGARGDIKELSDLLDLVASDAESIEKTDRWRSAVISGLGVGLARHRGELGRMTLSKLIAEPPQALADSVSGLQRILARFQQVATDKHSDLADRIAAVELLAYQPFERATTTLVELLTVETPGRLQAASVNALVSNGSVAAAEIVLAHWGDLRSATRANALAFLLRRTETTRMTLRAMSAGALDAASLSIDQRVLLLKHPDAKIQEQASELFGGAVSANRAAMIKQYEPAVALQGSVEAGKQVFNRVCATCHRRDSEGHEVGPDLSDVRNRSKETLMYEILDPNAKVEPRFTGYSVLTVNGQVFNGLLATETADAVVLTMAEGKQETIGRAQIEQMKVSNVSLMPEGIEKEVTIQNMADLLEFLKQR